MTSPIVVGPDGAIARSSSAGTFSALMPLDPSELPSGDVTLEIATQGVPLAWAPYVVNVDLVLGSD